MSKGSLGSRRGRKGALDQKETNMARFPTKSRVGTLRMTDQESMVVCSGCGCFVVVASKGKGKVTKPELKELGQRIKIPGRHWPSKGRQQNFKTGGSMRRLHFFLGQLHISLARFGSPSTLEALHHVMTCGRVQSYSDLFVMTGHLTYIRPRQTSRPAFEISRFDIWIVYGGMYCSFAGRLPGRPLTREAY